MSACLRRSVLQLARARLHLPSSVAVAATVLLASCASQPPPPSDNVADRIIAEDAARAAAASRAGNTYPDLRSVPPRPGLDYTTEQWRQIQDALVGDLQYARQTSELIRSTEGATPPPPPKLPVLAPLSQASGASVAAKAPTKVQLVERRDTSGNLSSFLDDVVGTDTSGTTSIEPTLVPSRNGLRGGERLPPDGAVEGQEVVGDPYNQSSNVTVRTSLTRAAAQSTNTTSSNNLNEKPTAAAMPPEQLDEAIEVGRIWLIPLRPGESELRPAVLAPILNALAQSGALRDRKLEVTGRSTQASRASQLARAVVVDLTERGVPAGQIQTRTDEVATGEAVLIRVIPETG